MPLIRDDAANARSAKIKQSLQRVNTTPQDNGLVGFNYHPRFLNNAAAMATNYRHCLRVKVSGGVTISNIWYFVWAAGGTLTAGSCPISLYNSAGTQVAVGPDQATPLATAGVKTAALTTAYTPAVDDYVYVMISMVATSLPSLGLTGPPSTYLTANFGMTSGKNASVLVGSAPHPASFTPSSLTDYYDFWVGLS